MNTTENSNILTSVDLLKNWQANRGLTRRVIEAFPEKELFEFSIAGMRPFSEMTKELLAIAGPGLDQIINGSDQILDEERNEWNSKEALLNAWDKTTEQINSLWTKMEDSKFEERIKLFGQYENTVFDSITYFVENEIHHRGQGYVYLRAIGIQPPFFWEK